MAFLGLIMGPPSCSEGVLFWRLVGPSYFLRLASRTSSGKSFWLNSKVKRIDVWSVFHFSTGQHFFLGVNVCIVLQDWEFVGRWEFYFLLIHPYLTPKINAPNGADSAWLIVYSGLSPFTIKEYKLGLSPQRFSAQIWVWGRWRPPIDH